MRQLSKDLLALSLVVGFTAAANSALAATTNSPTAKPVIYRLSQVEDAKKRAMAEGKPIAWIGTLTRYLSHYPNLKGKNSHAASAYAIRALQNETILVFSDGETENHQEPTIVDKALHSPDPHYNIPYVIILTPALDKVICKAPFAVEPAERIKVFTEVLKQIRDKDSWLEKKPEKKADK